MVEKLRKQLAFRNDNKAWVVAELKKLVLEWEQWQEHCAQIEDHPYNKSTHSEIWADGAENLNRHEILRAKTLTFLDNNLAGHNFMNSNECDEPFERTDLRLNLRVPHRVLDLRILEASIEYAHVPDSFWRSQGKLLVEKLADKAPEKAAEIAAGFLRNPTGIE